jgi:hypothetical protein
MVVNDVSARLLLAQYQHVVGLGGIMVVALLPQPEAADIGVLEPAELATVEGVEWVLELVGQAVHHDTYSASYVVPNRLMCTDWNASM